MVVLGFFGAGQCFVSPRFKYSCFFANGSCQQVLPTDPANRSCQSFTIQLNPLLQKETPYYRRKSLTMKGNPLLYQETHYYRMQSLTIEGNPLQQKEVHSYERKSLTVEGNPLLQTEILYYSISRNPGTVPGQSRDSPQYPHYRRKEVPYYRRNSLSIERYPLLQKDKSLL